MPVNDVVVGPELLFGLLGIAFGLALASVLGEAIGRKLRAWFDERER